MTLLDQLGPDGLRQHKRRLGRERTARYRRAQTGKGDLPFVGIDGEGGGRDDEGRQHYLLLRSSGAQGGARELFRDNRPLSTRECLEFILGLPKDAIPVWYFGTYDATQILRDLPPERIARLFLPTEPGRSPYTYWSGYAIEFKPRQYFRVARCQDGNRMKVIPGTARTVNEVGTFFQTAFLKVIKDWGIGTERQHQLIGASKDARDTFETMTQVERDYCRIECKLLARLMHKFRDTCREAGTMPVAWRGAGHIAAALHRDHETPKRRQIKRALTVERMANAAYYGGRFEIAAVGRIPGPVWEYDINSAYPAAMRRVPCALHTRWHKLARDAAPPPGALWIGHVRFEHPPGTPLCGLPIRHKGHLFWPRQGEGTYWGVEIEAAVRAGARVEHLGGCYAETRCACPGFDWIEPLYETRRQLGKATLGYPIKLGINGLYGKMAQRLGGAPFRDLVGAGLTTAIARAQLIDAYRAAPTAIVMMATDSIFSRVPLHGMLGLQLGPGLGQWEAKERPTGLFIVQPGVYWSPGSELLPKTRGIPASQIIAHRADFEALWDAWARGDGDDRPPTFPVAVKSFIGHRAALARGKPQMAGAWITAAREISFDWRNKREVAGELRGDADRYAQTSPFPGHPGLVSEPFDPQALTELREAELELEAQPDYEPWGNSGE